MPDYLWQATKKKKGCIFYLSFPANQPTITGLTGGGQLQVGVDNYRGKPTTPPIIENGATITGLFCGK